MAAKARIAVLGAGLMGHGIAQVFALAGHDVTITDSVAAALVSARDRISAIYLPDLFAYVSKRVKELSDDQQHPYASELKKVGELPLTKPKAER